jgi:hypothetical protein
MRFPWMLSGLLLLAGCGEDAATTPLAHALTALRAGDAAQLQAAQTEADAAVQAAIQPGQDLCAMSGADIAKYSAQYVIQKMNQPDILKLPEEERLLYALKFAGHHSRIPPDNFLNHAPYAIVMAHSGVPGKCDRDKELSAMMSGRQYVDADEDARAAALKGWIASLQAKYGNTFDDAMRSAKSQLENEGYSSAWPVDIFQE